MDFPQVSIVIPSFNEGEWLERTVRGCLEKTDYPDFEIIVVGDGCTDGSIEALEKKSFPNVRILNLPASTGAIVARNKGAEITQGEVLVFIDSHQEPVTENWLKVLVDLLKKNNCGAATINISSIGEIDRLGYLYTLKDWTLEPTWKRPENESSEMLAPAIPGGCFAIRKSLFKETGGFNPHLKKWGREDFEYSLRLWRLGYDLWFSDQAIMGHAFDHNRAFEISWLEVDFNTLWVAHTLMDQAAVDKVAKAIETYRPKSLKTVQKTLEKRAVCHYSEKLNLSFKRSFEVYKKQFIQL
jgi:GT2 family glycosyltransferase